MLRYSISDETLYSTTKSFAFSTKAYSGGGRGSTAGVQRTDLSHWSTGKKAPAKYSDADRGGPIPPGLYVAHYVGKYKHFGLVARLDQTITSLLQRDLTAPLGFKVTDRGGFLIHGEGPKGSDGCIVPASKEALKQVLTFIKASKSGVLLEVFNEGVRSDRFEGRSSAHVA
jgi:hypothetical protein